MARQLNLDGMCAVTGFKPTFMRAWCCRIDTPAYKFFSQWRCDEDELQAYIEMLQQPAPRAKKMPRRKKPVLKPGEWDLTYVHLNN